MNAQTTDPTYVTDPALTMDMTHVLQIQTVVNMLTLTITILMPAPRVVGILLPVRPGIIKVMALPAARALLDIRHRPATPQQVVLVIPFVHRSVTPHRHKVVRRQTGR